MSAAWTVGVVLTISFGGTVQVRPVVGAVSEPRWIQPRAPLAERSVPTLQQLRVPNAWHHQVRGR